MSESGKQRRPYVFDEEKRRLVIALVANGSSRRAAARYVGCAPSTITAAAVRDPDFAEQLHRAEQNAEIEILRALRAAARHPRHWRAAAWYLERSNPADFARRGPDTITWEQIGNLLTQVTELLADTTSKENHDRAIRLLNDLIVDVRARETPRLSDEFLDLPAATPPGGA